MKEHEMGDISPKWNQIFLLSLDKLFMTVMVGLVWSRSHMMVERSMIDAGSNPCFLLFNKFSQGHFKMFRYGQTSKFSYSSFSPNDFRLKNMERWKGGKRATYQHLPLRSVYSHQMRWSRDTGRHPLCY